MVIYLVLSILWSLPDQIHQLYQIVVGGITGLAVLSRLVQRMDPIITLPFTAISVLTVVIIKIMVLEI